jgi:tetratricopeptide (TPR) repeat protein
MELLVIAQSDEFAWYGLPPDKIASLLKELGGVPSLFARMFGERADDARWAELGFFRLPMFEKMAELPMIKSMTAGGIFSALSMVQDPAKMAELFGAVAETIPDGFYRMTQALFLERAGRLREAEAVLRQALELSSFTNHRKMARFRLIQVQWKLADQPETSPADQSVWRDKALANLRTLAQSGSLSPMALTQLTPLAIEVGDLGLALSLVESWRRQSPDDCLAWVHQVEVEFDLGAEARAQATLRELLSTATDAWKNLRPGFGHLRTVANSYRAAGQVDRAVACLEGLRDKQKTLFGGDDRAVLVTMNDLALAYEAKGKFAEATQLLQVVIAGLTAQLGADDPNVITSKGNLVHAYLNAGQADQAAPLIKEFVEAERKQLGAEDPRFASTLARLGSRLIASRKCREAEPLLRECLAIREKKEPDDWKTFNTNSMLGGALLGQGQFAPAEPLLLGGYQGMKQREDKIPPEGKVRLTEALERLVQLYDAWGKKDQADKWRVELENAKAATPPNKRQP